MPRGDEALDAKQLDGTEVESVEKGYALKRAQVLSALERRETPCAAVEFFNSQNENPESVKGLILKLLEDVRKHNRAELERVVADVESMLANYGEARVRQIQEDAAKHLLSWLDTSREPGPFRRQAGKQPGTGAASGSPQHSAGLRASPRPVG